MAYCDVSINRRRRSVPRRFLRGVSTSLCAKISTLICPVAHCCAEHLRLTAIFRHINAPQTQFFTPAVHFCAGKLQSARIFLHSNARWMHVVHLRCTSCVQHRCKQPTFEQQTALTHHSTCTFQQRVHLQCTLSVTSPVHCALTVYIIGACTRAPCTYCIHCQFILR